MSMNEKIVVVIPAYKPEKELLLPLVKELVKEFPYVLLIDDGSGEKYQSIFEEAKEMGALVERHYINSGKGRALKTAMNYILCHLEDAAVLVTADSDGQHSVEDIKKVALSALAHKGAYVLGARDFYQHDVPKKSRFGNVLTRNVFKLFVGLEVQDTQTGLRAMSMEVAKKLFDVKGERYEYETNALIACKEKDIPLVEEKISTIYLNDNKGSHFHPIRDSLMIYRLFLKYIFASVSSFVLDLFLFAVFYRLLGGVNAAFMATIIARILSSLYNFFINSKFVFKKMNQTSLIKYVLLVIVQMFVSAFVVNALAKIYQPVILIKIVVDTIIFVMNFIIQREWVFKNEQLNGSNA